MTGDRGDCEAAAKFFSSSSTETEKIPSRWMARKIEAKIWIGARDTVCVCTYVCMYAYTYRYYVRTSFGMCVCVCVYP